MSVELIVAIVGALTGLLGIGVSWRTARASARKDDLDVLRGIIAELRQKIEDLEAENEALRQRVSDLEQENERLTKLARSRRKKRR